MNNLTKVNKWAAIQVGVFIYDYKPFNIEDARCREIVREKLKLSTLRCAGGYVCMKENLESSADGKSIKEAEIACITALWESENERV